jgi:CMP-N-acetylneuraminic acid synthetase
MLQIIHKNFKTIPLQKIHLLMLILLKIINKEHFSSVFIDSDDKHL